MITKFPSADGTPAQKIRIHKVVQVIQHQTHPTKVPGYDLITGRILQELSLKGIRAITQLYNAILRLEYFPCHWKVGQILMIAKPGKKPMDVTSYWPNSLLLLLSKVLAKIILKRLVPILAAIKLPLSHQFGFRPLHGTIEQAHRKVHKINNAPENKHFCTTAFIDISQAFDKVWHRVLFYKLKQALLHSMYTLLASYLTNRTFQVRSTKNILRFTAFTLGYRKVASLAPFSTHSTLRIYQSLDRHSLRHMLTTQRFRLLSMIQSPLLTFFNII
jgi:hypothetical protein